MKTDILPILILSISIVLFNSLLIVGGNVSGKRAKRARLRHEINNQSLDTTFSRPDSAHRSCNTEQIEYRLTKLEVQLAEKSENTRAELHGTNQRLQTLEWHTAQATTNLDAIKSQLVQFINQTTTDNDNLQYLNSKIDTVSREIKLIITALRSLNADIKTLKPNTSSESRKSYDDHETSSSQTITATKLNQVFKINEDLPRNCAEIKARGQTASGIYKIQVNKETPPFFVLCEMNSEFEGGWTVIHNRYDGSQDFYLDWENYKNGFGNLGGEFWLGLEHLYQLTTDELNELAIELVDLDLGKVYAYYSAFSIGSEKEGYAMRILGGYSGNAGDSLTYHAGIKFTTKDLDNDFWENGNCAKEHGGGWWYRSCDKSNLNGKYLKGPLRQDYLYRGMYWDGFKGAQYSLLQARMMIKPRDEHSTLVYPDGIRPNRSK